MSKRKNQDEVDKPRGFLGSSLFPSFEPRDDDGEGDDMDEDFPTTHQTTSLSNSAFRSSVSASGQSTYANSNSLSVWSDRPVQKHSTLTTSFPSFSSFSFNTGALAAVDEVADRAQSVRSSDSVRKLERSKRERDESSDDSDRDYEKKKKPKKDKHKKDKKRKHDRKEKRDRHEARAEERDNEPKPFYYDRKGDPANLIYESLPRDKVPVYFRYGDNVLSPSSSVWRILRSKTGSGVVLFRFGQHKEIPFYKELKTALRGKPLNFKRLFSSLPSDDVEGQFGFVSFSRDDSGKTDADLIATEDGNAMYEETKDFMLKTHELSVALEKNPRNLDKWVEYINYQDTLMDAKGKRGALKLVINEKKIAIIEKALKMLPGNETLLCMYMDCCEQTWESTKLLTKWDTILQENIGSIALWNKYITFRQTNYASFTVTGCLEVYEECIDTLVNEDEGAVSNREEILIHLLTRACSLLIQSGFIERAIAIFQAMIEFNAFCPEAFEGQTLAQRLDMFEVFWESECPRFGEKGAVGWKSDITGKNSANKDEANKSTNPGLNEDDANDTVQPTEKSSNLLSFPIKSYPTSSTTMFANEAWFSFVDKSDVEAIDAQGVGRLDFIKALKSGRSMLKEDKMNLSLWHAYAQIELLYGNKDEARKILNTTIISYRTFPKQHWKDAGACYLTLVDIDLGTGRQNQALGYLIHYVDEQFNLGSIPSDTKPPPTKLLKTRKLYNDLVEQTIDKLRLSKNSGYDYHCYSLSVACAGLFEYISQGIEEALTLFDKTVSIVRTSLDESESLQELIMEQKARLILRHSQQGGAYRPALLREALEKDLEEYPDNAVLFCLYAHIESRTKIENRIRRYLDSAMQRRPSHIIYLFAVWFEMRQREHYNANSIRSWFEKAVECESSKHSVSIWYLFINFEVITKNEAKAKALFFRAIRECPWAKALYLLPFRILKSQFTDDELLDVMSLMEEKEIRIRNSISG
ncbi:hypothetical protein HDU76_012445 [Blyttiomyces sp. JEL0837]|nr:hypothetical protein HDU76_012445 [Blyttiomyces sp. JEL0837]